MWTVPLRKTSLLPIVALLAVTPGVHQERAAPTTTLPKSVVPGLILYGEVGAGEVRHETAVASLFCAAEEQP
jgi:hypothetical protein